MAQFVTRFAPSPTGPLHAGHGYSAILCHEAARAAAGRFLLRIEDIDKSRCKPHFYDWIIEDLTWLGLTWEEPVLHQSTRLTAYEKALEHLGPVTYPCFCTRADIRRHPDTRKGPMGAIYPGTCRALSARERTARIQTGEPYALRIDSAALALATGPLCWREEDPLDPGTAHEEEARPDFLGDVVIARKELMTSYHLAVVTDDARQGVSHVIRGMDLFHATHIQRLLQAALDLPAPIYRHHPLLMEEGGKKLSKSKKAESLRDLRNLRGLSPGGVRAMIRAELGDDCGV